MSVVSNETKTMTKAVHSTIGLLVLLATIVPARAQQAPSQIAQEEAIRREEALILLRQKLHDAQAAQAVGRLLEAAKLYEDAYARGLFVGDLAEPEMREVIDALIDVHMRLAEAAQKSGNLEEANTHAVRILQLE